MAKTIDDVRAVFAADKYLGMTGVVLDEIGEDSCRCSMEVAPIHMNAGGTAQGGAVYTLADSAFAIAANLGHIFRDEDLITVSQSASISYLRAAASGKLSAEAHKVGGGKKMSVYRMTVTDEEGRVVATMTGNGYAVPRK
ncbi:MAG: PaaI family thioesterase [Clostridiales Family XIII bacterium]|nr:PaaI family thioesterase [Clostridiales Family XIII bacterium]